MKRKLLRQINTQWRSNVWLVVELMIISVVMWFIVDLLTVMIRPMLEPDGFDIENCYKISFTRSGELKEGEPEMSKADERRELIRRLRRYPGVEAVAISNAIEPYCGSFMSTYIIDLDADSLQYGDNAPSLRYGYANADFIRVFRLEGLRGETPDELAEMFAKSDRQVLIAENFYLSSDSAKRADSSLDLLGHKLCISGRDEGGVVASVLKNVKRENTTPQRFYSFILFGLDDTSDDGLKSLFSDYPDEG